jgi:hypothetical protein
MSKELDAFKDAVSQAERMWHDLAKNREVTYDDVVYALSVAEARQSDASEKRDSYSSDMQKELDRLSGHLRDMRNVVIRPNLKRTTQIYIGPVNIV